MVKKIKIYLIVLMMIVCTILSYFAINITTYAKQAKTTIMLDAGHGGYDVGSIAMDGTYEKNYNLKIVKTLGKMLVEKGYNVVYTRTSDKVSWPDDNTLDLQARCDLAQNKNADYFISIHLNSSDYNDGAKGYEIYYDYSNKKAKKLSNSILKSLDTLNYSTNRGLLDTNENPLYVITNNTVPALLIETGFITDSSDLDYIKNHTKELCEAIVNGIDTSLS